VKIRGKQERKETLLPKKKKGKERKKHYDIYTHTFQNPQTHHFVEYFDKLAYLKKLISRIA